MRGGETRRKGGWLCTEMGGLEGALKPDSQGDGDQQKYTVGGNYAILHIIIQLHSVEYK